MMSKWMFACLFACLPALGGWAQERDSITVRENYFGTSLLRVLNDFETKYVMPLRYDPALVVP